jgi:hypothetical protein
MGHGGQNTKCILARLKATNTRRALFFCACVVCRHVASGQQLPLAKKSRHGVGGAWRTVAVTSVFRGPAASVTASGSPAARAGDTTGHIPPPPLTYFERIQPGSA